MTSNDAHKAWTSIQLAMSQLITHHHDTRTLKAVALSYGGNEEQIFLLLTILGLNEKKIEELRRIIK